MSRKKSNSVQELLLYIDRTKHIPFKWGSQDCAIWALGAIDVQCGTQIAVTFSGMYNSEQGAQSFLKERGWTSLANGIEAVLATPPMAKPAHAQKGDILCMPDSIAPHPYGCLVVNVGARCFGPGERGLVAVPTLDLLKAGAVAFRV